MVSQCAVASMAEAGTIVPCGFRTAVLWQVWPRLALLHLMFRRDQGSVPRREWDASLSSLALLRDAKPGGRDMRAPGWGLTLSWTMPIDLRRGSRATQLLEDQCVSLSFHPSLTIPHAT